MKKLLVILLLGLVAASMAVAPESKYSDEMVAALATADSSEYIRTYVTLSVQLDEITLANLTYGLSTRAQHNVVVKSWLQEAAATEQTDLLAWLEAHPEMATRIKPFWISNFVIVDLTPAGIAAVAARNEVVDLHAPSTALVDPSLFVDDPFNPDIPASTYVGGKEITWGITKTNADDVWAMGYDGTGVLASIGDTGTRYTHNDMDHNYNASYSHDYEDDDSDPMDSHGHGTHCSGTVLGNGDAGSQTGMAPDATLCANRVYHNCSLTEYEDYMWEHWQDAVSWGLDLISISSGLQQGWGPRNSTWRTNAQNTIAGGVVLAIAFGNEGSSEYRTPGCIPEVITVGATDSSDVIASFSSRGPVTVWGGSIIKPDVTAPGVDTKSASHTSDTGYTTMSGTSMATPHVGGAVALILDADPSLTHAQVKALLENTAVDLGDAGKDNTYGSGRIDVLAAVQQISDPAPHFSLNGVEIVSDGNSNGYIDPGESVTVEVEITNSGTADGTSVQGTLTCSDGDITITTGSASFGTVASGGTATAQFSFDVSSGAGQPDSFDFDLSVQASGEDAQDFDFTLHSPTYAIFDDVESGEGHWTHSGSQDQWHISSTRSNSSSHSWKCGSTGSGDYADNMDASLYSAPVVVDASNNDLTFYTWYDLETSYDYGYVEVDGGSGYTQLATYNGSQSSFAQKTISLSSYAGDVVTIRFHMTTDTNTNEEGWYIDDIALGTASDAAWLFIENRVEEDGVLLSWTADEGFAGFNVYRALADNRDARIKLNSAVLTAGTSGAWLDVANPGEYLYYIEALEASGEGVFYGPVEVTVRNYDNLSVALAEPYPNPAVELVNIELSLANDSTASVVIYDIAGRRVATLVDGQLSAGRHNLTWDSSLAASGVYLVQMQAEGETLNRRVVISR